VATIRRAEVVEGEIPVTLANEAAIRRAFENVGIDFIEDNGGGEGVRFRKSQVFKKRQQSSTRISLPLKYSASRHAMPGYTRASNKSSSGMVYEGSTVLL
jgi:hypothetical protein